MIEQARGDRLQRLLDSASQHEEFRQTRAGAAVVRVRIDRRLIKLHGFAQVTPALGHAAVPVKRFGVLRLDLQRIAEFNAGFVEVAGGKVLLAALHVTLEPGMRAAAASQQQYATEHGQKPYRRPDYTHELHGGGVVSGTDRDRPI